MAGLKGDRRMALAVAAGGVVRFAVQNGKRSKTLFVAGFRRHGSVFHLGRRKGECLAR